MNAPSKMTFYKVDATVAHILERHCLHVTHYA